MLAMVLDDLHELIETLQARIDAHGAELQRSEALTRYTLIDPLLRELGWDTAEPNQVRVELPLAKGYAQQGFADYALLGEDGKPRVVIEAKSLGTSLQQAAMQALGYCNALGFPYFAVTDGRFWELYETFRPVPLPEKLVMSLDVRGPVALTCLNALALWQSGVRTQTVQPGAIPVVGDKPTDSQSDDSSLKPPNEAPVPDEIVDTSGWETLSELASVGNAKPAAVRLPGGKVETARGWSNMTATLVQWLFDNGHLQQNLMPIQSPNAKRYIVSTSPKHPSGTPFKRPRQIGSFYVEMNHSGSSHIVNSRTIIERTNHDPSEFGVRLQ